MTQMWDEHETPDHQGVDVDCPLCVARGGGEALVALSAAWLRVPRRACLSGYACLVLNDHFAELHDVPEAIAGCFFADLRRASGAVAVATGATKINLLSLGNQVPHLHVHICPRTPGDRFADRLLDLGDLTEAVYSDDSYAEYLERLRSTLEIRS